MLRITDAIVLVVCQALGSTAVLQWTRLATTATASDQPTTRSTYAGPRPHLHRAHSASWAHCFGWVPVHRQSALPVALLSVYRRIQIRSSKNASRHLWCDWHLWCDCQCMSKCGGQLPHEQIPFWCCVMNAVQTRRCLSLYISCSAWPSTTHAPVRSELRWPHATVHTGLPFQQCTLSVAAQGHRHFRTAPAQQSCTARLQRARVAASAPASGATKPTTLRGGPHPHLNSPDWRTVWLCPCSH